MLRSDLVATFILCPGVPHRELCRGLPALHGPTKGVGKGLCPNKIPVQLRYKKKISCNHYFSSRGISNTEQQKEGKCAINRIEGLRRDFSSGLSYQFWAARVPTGIQHNALARVLLLDTEGSEEWQ